MRIPFYPDQRVCFSDVLLTKSVFYTINGFKSGFLIFGFLKENIHLAGLVNLIGG